MNNINFFNPFGLVKSGNNNKESMLIASDTSAVSNGIIINEVIDLFEFPPIPDDCPFDLEDKQYFVNTQIKATVAGRVYHKNNNQYAIGMIAYISPNYTIPLFLSPIEDAVGFTYNSSAAGSFDYLGTTWYYSGTQYAMGGDNRSSATGLTSYLKTIIYSSSYDTNNLIQILDSLKVINKEG